MTTLSEPSGVLLPTSSVIGVGAKSCVNKSLGVGSSAVKANLKSSATLFFAVCAMSSISVAVKPALNSCCFSTGYGSRERASSKSSRYHSIRTPEVW